MILLDFHLKRTRMTHVKNRYYNPKINSVSHAFITSDVRDYCETQISPPRIIMERHRNWTLSFFDTFVRRMLRLPRGTEGWGTNELGNLTLGTKLVLWSNIFGQRNKTEQLFASTGMCLRRSWGTCIIPLVLYVRSSKESCRSGKFKKVVDLVSFAECGRRKCGYLQGNNSTFLFCLAVY